MLEVRGTIIIMWWQGRTRVLGGHESVCLFLEKLTHRPRRQKIDLESDTPVTMQRRGETSAQRGERCACSHVSDTHIHM